jgi:phage gp29-like protein
MKSEQELKNVIATRQKRLMLKLLMYLQNPDKILSSKGIDVYRDMLNDAHVYSCVQSRFAGILKLKWDINRGDADTPVTRFVRDILNSFNMRKIIREMLDAPLFGYKPMEILYQYRYSDGKIIPVDIIGKPSEWFVFDENNQCRFVTAYDSNGVKLPAKKFLVVQHNASYDNPYGESLLTKCYYPVMFKKGGMEFWVTFTEKYGMPFLIALLGETASDKEMEDTQDALDEAKQDSSLVLRVNKDEASINLMEAAKTSSADVYERLLHFNNAEISKAILSQTLTTEQGDTGSYAMSQTHLQVRDDVVDSDKNLVEFYFNQLISWICEINFGPDTKPPVFELYSEKEVDINLAQRDQAIQQGNPNFKYRKIYYVRNYGIKEDEFDIVEPETPPTPPGAFAEDDATAEAHQTAVDSINAVGINDFSKLSSSFVQPVLDLINQDLGYDELQDKVVNLFPEMSTDDIEELIAKSILIANGAGMLSEVK